MPNKLTDWSVQLGWDTSKVDDGLKKLDAKLKGVGKATGSSDRSEARAKAAARRKETIHSRGIIANNIRMGKFELEAYKEDRTRTKNTIKSKVLAQLESFKREALHVKAIGINTDKSKAVQREIDKAHTKAIIDDNIRAAKTIRVIKRPEQFAQSTRLTRQSQGNRFSNEGIALRGAAAGAAGVAALSGLGGGEASTLTSQLNAEMSKLAATQKKLTAVTYSNSPAYHKLRDEIRGSTMEIGRLNSRVKQLRAESGGTNSVLSSITRSFKNMTIAAVSAYAVIAGGKALIETSKRLDSVRASMLAASGSAVQAKADFEFIRMESKRLGSDLFTSAKGFQQIGTSMRAAGFDSAVVKEVFIAASEASVAFGLSVDDTAGVMKAFSQIASKGTVSAEELRQQLGDRLPGAFQMAATAMGITTTELDKLLQAGALSSDVFLPKMAAQLRKTVSETGALAKGLQTISAAQGRFKTTSTEFAEGLLDAGGKETIKEAFSILTDLVKTIQPLGRTVVTILSPFVSALGGVVKGFSVLATPILTAINGMVNAVRPTEEMAKSIERWEAAIRSGNTELDGTVEKISFIQRLWFNWLGSYYTVLANIDDFGSTFFSGMGGIVPERSRDASSGNTTVHNDIKVEVNESKSPLATALEVVNQIQSGHFQDKLKGAVPSN